MNYMYHNLCTSSSEKFSPCFIFAFFFSCSQKFVVPLSHNSVLSHEDYSAVFSNIQVRKEEGGERERGRRPRLTYQLGAKLHSQRISLTDWKGGTSPAFFRPEDKVVVFVLNPAAIAELVREPAGTTEVSDGGLGREMYKDRGHFCAHGKNKTTVSSLIPTPYLASFPDHHPHSHTTPSLIPRPPPAVFPGYNY